MKAYVQIVNVEERKATRFSFEDLERALSFEKELIALFVKHSVNSMVGAYEEGEKCPLPPEKRDWAAWTTQPPAAESKKAA